MTSTKIAMDTKKPTKAEQVQKLLKRTRGATMAEMVSETGWQAHSVRAFLTGLRKKGHIVAKEERKPGLVAYRISTASDEQHPDAPEKATA